MLEPRAEGQSSPLASAQIGDVIHGKYRVERVIGEGGMGVVVAARHLTLDKLVALKLLSAKSRESEEALERFTREARAAARIQSEHVGRVLDVDALANGTPFIVMELLEGHDLADELRRTPKLPYERAVVIVLQACEAIAEAHAAGIVHRDLKPANLFLSKAATDSVAVKVLDFGISKFTRREASIVDVDKSLTNPSTMLGSPLYMSPEQMQASGDVDSRTDIWSLGVILYEEMTGRSPFDGATVPMICANVLAMAPLPLGVEGIPERLERVVMRCLEKDPTKRFRDIGHLARALTPFAPAQGKVSVERISQLKDLDGAPAISPASIAPPPHREGAATITSWGTKGVPTPKKRGLPIAIAVGVTVLVLGGVGVRMLMGDDAPTHAVVATARATAKEGAAPIDTATEGAAPAPTEEPTAAPSATAEDVESSASASAAPSATVAPIAPYVRPHPWPTAKPKGRTSGFGGRE